MPAFLTRGIAWLPISNFVLFLLTLTVAYSISQAQDLVMTPLPFISDTGTFPPASCWFTFLLNAACYSVVCTGVIRYFQTRDYLEQDAKAIRCLNFFGLVLVIVGSLGLSMVASFQETSVFKIHALSAMVAFSCSSSYALIQVYITRCILEDGFSRFNNFLIYWIRLFLFVLNFTALITMVIFYHYAGILVPHDPRLTSFRPLPYHDERYYYITTSSEWTVAISFSTFLLTFAYEFSKVNLSMDIQYEGYMPIQWNS